MAKKQDVSQIPRAVAEMLEKTSASLQSSLRGARPGEGPVFILCQPFQMPAAWTASCAIEIFLGRAAIIRTFPAFQSYTIQSVAARSNVLVFPGAAESEEGLQVLKKLRSRGAVIWAFTNEEQTGTAGLAHGVLSLRQEEEQQGSMLPLLARHLAALVFAIQAAKLLRSPSESVQECEREVLALPGRMDWAFANLADAAVRFVGEIQKCERIVVAGGGAFHAAALEAARNLRRSLGNDSRGFEVGELEWEGAMNPVQGGRVLFLSGSRCRMKKEVHNAASNARIAGCEIFSLTDSNDRELISRSAASLLTPVLPELPGAILALTLALWINSFAGHGSNTSADSRKKTPARVR